MKQKLYIAGTFLLLLFLLAYPREALLASRNGMKLWLNTLIPTLLPFIILTGILLHTNGIEKILFPLKSFFRIVFGLSPCGAYAFFLGMLCGYPLGAKLTSDLFTSHKISRQEAHYLLTFSNNASPVFVMSYLCHICLKDSLSTGTVFISLLSADFICMLFFRFFIFKNQTYSVLSGEKKETSPASLSGALLDVSIMNGFETITRLGGYILLFSILTACIMHYWPSDSLYKYILPAFTEITTGISLLSSSKIPLYPQAILSVAATASGGMCILAQTRSVLDRKLSIFPYLTSKCMQTALTAAILSLLIA